MARKGADAIDGGGGNDLFEGNGGSDIIRGGDGADYIRGLSGGTVDFLDKLFGGAGDDCILEGSCLNQLFGEAGNDVLLIGHDNRFTSTQCAPADWDFGEGRRPFATAFTLAEPVDDRGLRQRQRRDLGPAGSGSIHGGNGNDGLDGDFDGNDYSDQLFGDAGTDTLIGDSSDICYPGSRPETAPCD